MAGLLKSGRGCKEVIIPTQEAPAGLNLGKGEQYGAWSPRQQVSNIPMFNVVTTFLVI
jgi:hypothetical protein